MTVCTRAPRKGAGEHGQPACVTVSGRGGGIAPHHERLLTTAEVARLFDVDMETVTRWARANVLTSLRTAGGHRRYRETVILEVIERLKRERADDAGPPVVRLTASRLRTGSVMHAQLTRRRWEAPNCIWDGQPMLHPARYPLGSPTTVTQAERQSTPLTAGARTEIVLWTEHGVLICAPGTALSVLRESAPIWPDIS
jgi:excisionase family DNA binding protein